ncbi:hypothetical protein DFH09DRAFT_394721 [Mycena vulgaris]|nr:hypothetical protein DFH09DRAFT_394721 [Mycena vulgaris]
MCSSRAGDAPPPGMSYSPSQSDSSYSSVSSAGHSLPPPPRPPTPPPPTPTPNPPPPTHLLPQPRHRHQAAAAPRKVVALTLAPARGYAGYGCMSRTGQSLLASALGRVGDECGCLWIHFLAFFFWFFVFLSRSRPFFPWTSAGRGDPALAYTAPLLAVPARRSRRFPCGPALGA